jgi:hypothetical protein
MLKEREIMGGIELGIVGGIFILGGVFGLVSKDESNSFVIAVVGTFTFFGAVALYAWLVHRIKRKVADKEKDLIKKMAYEFGRQDKEQELKELYGDTDDSGALS